MKTMNKIYSLSLVICLLFCTSCEKEMITYSGDSAVYFRSYPRRWELSTFLLPNTIAILCRLFIILISRRWGSKGV